MPHNDRPNAGRRRDGSGPGPTTAASDARKKSTPMAQSGGVSTLQTPFVSFEVTHSVGVRVGAPDEDAVDVRAGASDEDAAVGPADGPLPAGDETGGEPGVASGDPPD
jgi:hypothetical protein